MPMNRPVVILATPLPDGTAKLRMHGLYVSGQHVRVMAHRFDTNNQPLGMLDGLATHAAALSHIESSAPLATKFQSVLVTIFNFQGTTIGPPLEPRAVMPKGREAKPKLAVKS
jgi:hypothetical protein